MPKAAKSGRARLHTKAAKLSKSQTVDEDVQDSTRISEDASIIPTMVESKHRKSPVESKLPQKQTQSRDELSGPSHPYHLSKSSRKRVNKKQREDLSGGSLSAVGAALGAVLQDQAEDHEEESDDDMDSETVIGGKKRRRGRGKKAIVGTAPEVPVKIGEGKGRTLKERQRKEQIATSRAHVQAVLLNPAFKANPFAAIRAHAGNSLEMNTA